MISAVKWKTKKRIDAYKGINQYQLKKKTDAKQSMYKILGA